MPKIVKKEIAYTEPLNLTENEMGGVEEPSATLEEIQSAIDITEHKLRKALDKQFALNEDIASLKLTLDLLMKESCK